MAGAGLVEIKRRMRSITNTRKITRAMNVVATSKLKKSRRNLENNNKYYNLLDGTMKKVISVCEDTNLYKDGNKVIDKLYIVITSDSGLCGGFNGEVINTAVKQIKRDKKDFSIIVVGQKGRAYFNKLNYETVAEYVDIKDIPTTKEAAVLANDALKMYEGNEVGEVNIIYSQFISTVRRKMEIRKILPLNDELNNEQNSNNFVELEPDANSILNENIKSYLTQSILNCMLNSKSSEQAARMEAMSNATQNANDLLEKLNIKYNRIRQSSITQEIAEIVGGAEAQK
ncbi:ATP synthase F1 subunit gamma [Haloimpatiens sp. FM7330]|uniref:ATP synthase F1 subunit gamma n=1 Tax=Haloimpatiens sp. FM7330 TaxID=3298610 RepID=UPI003644FDFC